MFPQELKDKNDELTMEVEHMRQQLHSVRRRLLSGGSGQCPEGAAGQQPQRSGSVLSDYTRPVIESRRPDSVSGIAVIVVPVAFLKTHYFKLVYNL